MVLGCLAMGMPPAEVKARFDQIVDFSGVGNFIDLPMRAYSTGMAQRLRFAIAAAKSHEILMIDEALATGDASFRTKSHDRIKQLREEAGTVFLVAHNLGEIEQSCTRVLWMEAGQILRDSDDVPGVIDEYLAATGGEPRDRERARLLSPGADPGRELSELEGQAHDGAALWRVLATTVPCWATASRLTM